MITSIGKLTKSILFKILVGIIILPFVFWGMGDVFRGGNQNVVATIDSKKVSTQEFVNYFNRLDLNNDQLKSLPKTDLLEKVLSKYIGDKVMELEIENSKIFITDKSLRKIIKNDKLFFKEDKFSRTKYEKFLLESKVTAPTFEKNIAEQESRRQFLDFFSGGIIIPDILVENEFKKENQIKTIKYIDLEKYYEDKKPTKEKIKEVYAKNKDSFLEEFKSIQFTELKPQIISGNTEYNESFFKQLDIIENKILDGQSFEEAVKENNLNINLINKVNASKKDENKKVIKNLPDDIFKKIYNLKSDKTPEIIKVKSKYFLAEIKSTETKNKSIEHPDVIKAINAQLKFENKIKINTTISKDISMGAFDKLKMEKFAAEKNLKIEDYTISDLKQNEIFSEGIIKSIFLTANGKVSLITNNILTKNFIILPVKTEYKKLKKPSNEFDQYQAKAKLNIINTIYRSFDDNLNKKYKVVLNERTIDRVKKSF